MKKYKLKKKFYSPILCLAKIAMDNLLLIISIFILSFDIKTRAEDDTLVNISDGLLKGTIITSRNGRNISAFLGVPYAEPPIGNLR